MKTRWIASSLLLLAICLPATAKGFGNWKPVTNEGGETPTLYGLLNAGGSMYALGPEPDADRNNPAWLLEAETAKPVTGPDGTQVSLFSLAPVGGRALGAHHRSDDKAKYDLWRLDGEKATPLLDEDGEPLTITFPLAPMFADAPDCPYFGAQSSKGPPGGANARADLYWLGESEIKRLDPGELSFPRYAWTGKHLILTNKGATYSFTDGKMTELKSADDKKLMLYPSSGCGDVIATESGVHLYRIDGGTVTPIPLPEGHTDAKLFQLGDSVYVWMKKVVQNVFMKVDGNELKPTPLTKTLDRVPINAFQCAAGVAVTFARNEKRGTNDLVVCREGKASFVKPPKGCDFNMVHRLVPYGDGHLVVAQGVGGKTLLMALDAKNKLKVVDYPETKFHPDEKGFIVSDTGMYWHYTDEDNKATLLYVSAA
ncbi:MAG: hypothetical protein KDB82_10855 [Planctomycetes bacterium]|nr:hypothetical protein [Planctomycetota bacterium]